MVQGWVIWNVHKMCISMATLVNVEWQLSVQSLASQVWAPNIKKKKKNGNLTYTKKTFWDFIYIYIYIFKAFHFPIMINGTT